MNIFPTFVRNLYVSSTVPTQEMQADIFVQQRHALSELMQRRTNLKLKRQITRDLDPAGRVLLSRLRRPSAILFRQVASPTQETLRFLTTVKHMGLQAFILEYSGDKFVSAGNSFKRALGKMPIYRQMATDGREIVHYRTIVDFNSYVGKPLSDVRCKNGESLIDFHHNLMQKVVKFDTNRFCLEATPWFQSSGGNALGYYEQFLMLFIRDAILFEEVLPTASEEQFARDVIIPAFTSVTEKFGLKPLIIELIPKNKSGRIYWDSYTKEVEKYM